MRMYLNVENNSDLTEPNVCTVYEKDIVLRTITHHVNLNFRWILRIYL